MNKKLTVLNGNESTLTAVLDGSADYEDQLYSIFRMSKRGGEGVDFDEKEIRLIDIFHQEVMYRFKILSYEDCDEPISLCWTKITDGVNLE